MPTTSMTWSRRKTSKIVTWTSSGRAAFKKLKDLVNAFPKIYIIKKEYKIILYTDASDYSHRAYLFRVFGGKRGV